MIMLGWPAGADRGDDFEIADPYGEAGGDPEDALVAVSAFYARTYQLVGVQGAERLWEFSRTPGMNRDTRRALFQTDRRVAVNAFSRVSVAMIFDDGTIEFGGSFWMTSAVPFKREENEVPKVSLAYCYIGVDKRVVATIGGETPLELLALTWTARQGQLRHPARRRERAHAFTERRAPVPRHLPSLRRRASLRLVQHRASSSTIDLRTPRRPE